MPVIHSYFIKPSQQIQHISFPIGSKIVSCGVQDGRMVMWVLKINPDEDQDNITPLRFMVVETGWNIDASEYYPVFVDTVQLDGDVCHVLEMQEYSIKRRIHHVTSTDHGNNTN